MFQGSHLKFALAAIGMLVSAASHAQDYPTKPITLIVPWPAGGSTDISMRAIAESAAKGLGQPIALDTKAGGPADRDGQQGGRRRHGGTGDDGSGGQAGWLHPRANPDHGVPPAAD